MKFFYCLAICFLLSCQSTTDPKDSKGSVSRALSTTADAGFKRAMQVRPFTFPEDEGPHPGFQTEWWYYTGNLETSKGRHFGYQVTFFKRALSPLNIPRLSAWGTSDIFFAHVALSDIQNKKFMAFQRFSRGGKIGLSGATKNKVWLENWAVNRHAKGNYSLNVKASDFELDFNLNPQKQPVLQGDSGLSQKSKAPGNASYYYSRPRLNTSGHIKIGNEYLSVQGLSWLDREWSTSALSPEQIGWDWFSLQFDDGRELMLYQMRLKNGKIDSFSSGTLIDSQGETTPLSFDDYTIEPLGLWRSPHTGIQYPQQWRIHLPKHNLKFQVIPWQSDQELRLDFTYWEGAVKVVGENIKGQGYVELTGYE